MKTKYAISLGLDCAMAGLLKDCGVRTFSSPFDWLDHSDIQTRTNLIKNGFQDFLNKEDLQQIFIQNDKQHAFFRYRNTRTDLYFHHDFISTKSFDEAFVEVKQKYEHRIQHFMEVCKNPKQVSFFILDRASKLNKQDIIDAFDGFKEQIIVISHNPEINQNSFEKYQYKSNIVHYFVNNISVDESAPFQKFKGNIPVISQIILERTRTESFFMKKKYKVWKWLTKKMRKLREKQTFGIYKKCLFKLWKMLTKDLFFTNYVKEREEILKLEEEISCIFEAYNHKNQERENCND